MLPVPTGRSVLWWRSCHNPKPLRRLPRRIVAVSAALPQHGALGKSLKVAMLAEDTPLPSVRS